MKREAPKITMLRIDRIQFEKNITVTSEKRSTASEIKMINDPRISLIDEVTPWLRAYADS
jgi:hypothetical protein